MPFAFLNSIALWGGLAAAGVAVPVAIHLFNRFRHRTVAWGAMALLRRATKVRSRQIKLEDILLMILRALALLLIGLALARPIDRSGVSETLGASRQVGVVIAIDASMSMGHTGIQSRLEQAKQRARELFDQLEPGHPTTLLVMGRRPQVLLPNVSFERERFETALGRIEVKPEQVELDANLAMIESLVGEMKTPVRECYIIGDTQASDWAAPSAESKRAIERIAHDARLLFVSTTGEGADNLAITRFELTGGTLRRGTISRYIAEVRNHGQVTNASATVTLSIDGRPVERRPLGRIEPGESVAVPLFPRFDTAGAVRLTATINQDALADDNARHAVAFVRDSVAVLVVDGDPANNPDDSETNFILRGLQPKRTSALGASLRVERVTWLDLPAINFDDFDVVMLANVVDLHPDQVSDLTDWVERGGGLMFFVGDKVDPRVFNARMNRDGESLSPLRFIERADADETGTTGFAIEPVGKDHPLEYVLAGLPRDLVDAVRLRSYLRAELVDGARSLWRVTGREDVLLAERAFGRGRVVAYASTADRDWTDLPIYPVGPMMLHAAVTHLTSPIYEQQKMVGDELALPLPRMPADHRATLISPRGEQSRIDVIERDGRVVVDLKHAEHAGFYAARYAKDEPEVVVAVNAPSNESDVKPIEPAALADVLAPAEIAVIEPGMDIGGEVEAKRRGAELWGPLLIAALLVLLLESLLAKRFSNRVSRGEVKQEDLLPTRAAALEG